MSGIEPTVSVPLYGTKAQIWKIVSDARRARSLSSGKPGRRPETLVFLACHWATIDFALRANKKRFSQASLIAAVEQLMENRREWIGDPEGELTVPHRNTIKALCRAWLTWRGTKDDSKLERFRPLVRAALIDMKNNTTEDVWRARYCENEIPESLASMISDKDKIQWNNIQVKVTKLVRSLLLSLDNRILIR